MDVSLMISYAPTGRASCKACRETIRESGIRLSKAVHLPWMASRGPRYAHFHLECGVAVVERTASRGDHMRLSGVETLSAEDFELFRGLYDPIAPALVNTHARRRRRRLDAEGSVRPDATQAGCTA